MVIARKKVVVSIALVLCASFFPSRAEEPPPPPPAAAPAGALAPAVADDPLPAPEALREQVEFWKSVFAVWSMAEVVLHDTDHPALVYETFALPGEIGETYSRSQRDFVRAREKALEAALAVAERKIAAKADLTDAEKELALKITTTAGIASIGDAHLRVRSQRGLRERFRRGLEISGRYDAEFRRVFHDAGLPEDLAYLPHVESSFQSSARSSAGAVGIWQFTRPAARKFMFFTSAIDERLDPVAAARGAARYLLDAYETLQSWPLAITAYNHGVEGMSRARQRFGTDIGRIVREYDGKRFGFASKNFYAEFLAAREIARDPVRFFPEGLRYEPPLSHDRVVLEQRMTPIQVSRAYGVPLDDLAALNPAWTRRAVRGGHALPAGTVAWLPEGTIASRRRAPQGSEKPPAQPLAKRPAAEAPRSSGSGRAASAETADAVTEVIVHVVRRGETLFRIATRYGVSVGDLLGLNQLTAQSVIRPGQRLRIPLVP